MRVTVERSEIHGRITAPSSKSMTHRAVICSALARGRSRVERPLSADDTKATLRVVQALGVGVEKLEGSWIIEGGGLSPSTEALDCGESGTTLRLMTAVCALVEGTSVLKGGPSLSGRPVEPLLEALRQLGVDCESGGGNPRGMLEDVCRNMGHHSAICRNRGPAGFALIVPDCERREAVELGNQIITKFRDAVQVAGDSGDDTYPASLGIGAATVSLPPKNFPPQDLFTAADRCLYGSHASGGGVVKSIEIY